MNFYNLINLQIQLFFYMVIGYVLCKMNLLSSNDRKGLGNLVVYVVLPANIITSFIIKMNIDILVSGLLILLLSSAIQISYALFSKYLYKKNNEEEAKVLRYATICSNAGYMGSPLVEGIYGSQGLLYASIYLIPQRIVMWSSGLSCFCETNGKDVFKKVISHPCIIAVLLGVILLATQITLPEVMVSMLHGVGRCNTFLSMVVIGGILAEIDIKSVISPLSIYYSGIRLVGIPLFVLFVCYILNMPYLVSAVSSVLAGMPAGTTTAILAEKYGGDSKLAVRIIFLSTILSLFTIPMLCMLIEMLY